MPPSRILLIRHGEKPGDPGSDKVADGTGLSVRGQIRAAALSVSIPAAYPNVNFLFATAASAKSNRPVLTITPLAKSLGLKISAKHADKDYAALAQHLLTHDKYAGKLVLVCWHHGKLPKLANALGVTPPVDPWPSEAFARIWQIDFPSTSAPTVVNLPQALLIGDSPK
jgi:hypothetical protein